MALTRKEYTGNGSTTLYNVDFELGYIDRDYVYVYLDGNEPENQLSYTWQNSNQIELNEPVTLGTKFYIRRIIPRDNLVNDYTNGALLRANNLNDSYLQTLMILQEVQDGFITADDEFLVLAKLAIVQNLDMAGYKIENLQEAEVDTDATTLAQVKNLINLASNLDGYTAQLIDYLKLEIFQSPTDRLTKIKTRTLLGGEVYEVRKVSDGSFADIYTDKEGLNHIAQNGTNNLSGSDGVVEFFVADGDYYVEVNSVVSSFKAKKIEPFDTVADMESASYLSKYAEDTEIIWDGYYTKGDGGGNKGLLKFGAHTADGGSIFSVDANTYIKVEFKGVNINARKWGVKADGIINESPRLNALTTYLKANPTSPVSGGGGGFNKVKLPKGKIRIASTWILGQIYGLEFSGAGDKATQIILDTDSPDVLLRIVGFIGLKFKNIRFYSGVSDESGFTPDAILKNTCFETDGTGGGTDLTFEDCSMYYFDTMHDVGTGNNQDNVFYIRCKFMRCHDIISNDNFQTLNWKFDSCKAYYNTGTVFRNPGIGWRIVNMDSINPGVWMDIDSQNFAQNVKVESCYFETYRNINPLANPVYLRQSSNTLSTITFDSTHWADTNSNLLDDVCFDLDGSYYLTFKDSSIECGGEMSFKTDQVVGHVSTVEFDNVQNKPPVITRTVKAGNGNARTAIISKYGSPYKGGYVYKSDGVNSSNTTEKVTGVMDSSYTFHLNEFALNNETIDFTRQIPELLEDDRMMIKSIDISSLHNTSNTYTLGVYSDVAKTQKIYEITSLGDNEGGQIIPFDPALLLRRKDKFYGESNNNLYFDITSTSNVGWVSVKVSIVFVRVPIR